MRALSASLPSARRLLFSHSPSSFHVCALRLCRPSLLTCTTYLPLRFPHLYAVPYALWPPITLSRASLVATTLANSHSPIRSAVSPAAPSLVLSFTLLYAHSCSPSVSMTSPLRLDHTSGLTCLAACLLPISRASLRTLLRSAHTACSNPHPPSARIHRLISGSSAPSVGGFGVPDAVHAVPGADLDVNVQLERGA